MTGAAGTAAALDLFGKISDACAAIVATNTDWGLSGERDTQYSVDLLVDAACVPPLLAAGYAVLSEESGLQYPPGGRTGPGAGVVSTPEVAEAFSFLTEIGHEFVVGIVRRNRR